MNEPAAPKKKGNPLVGCAFLLVLGGAGLWFLSGSGLGVGAPTHTSAPAAAAWQPPASFALAPDDPTVAVRWMDTAEFKCTYSSGACWGMEVVARDGCPSSLYVELSLMDATGAAVGYTNAVAGSVSPGQHAKLVFDTLKEGVAKARLTQVSCY